MRCCSAARVSLLLTTLLCVVAFAAEPRAALLQARDALEQALARPAERKLFLQRAENALAPLPSETRTPLQQQIADAAASGKCEDIRRARRSVEAYLRSLVPSPAPNPDAVKAQLNAIFAEPDMYVPPKSLLERLSEAFLRALEVFFDWLRRIFRGLGAPRLGGLEPFLQWFVIVLLVLTIGLAASYLLGRVRLSRKPKPPALAAPDAFADARAMGALEWRELARRLAFEGNWQLAARAYYLGLLRLLHEARLLDYDPALTNWEHLQRLRLPPLPRLTPSPAPLPDPALREEAYQTMRPLTLQFDALWYGGAALNEGIYREFENAFETLYRRLQPYAVSA